jgi:hypothetical protein
MTTAVGAMAPDNMLTMMRKANPDTKENKCANPEGYSAQIVAEH